jgi:peptidoglycan/xylan/chitin deacetylase (PgdA/CDA1 family)
MQPRRASTTLGLALAAVLLATSCHALGKARGTLGIFGERDPRMLYSVSTSERLVALTIDDGPDPASTARILEILQENQAKATFFLVADRVRGNEDVVDAIVAAGHELGNHHYRDTTSIDLTRGRFERDLVEAHALLSAWATPRWFRPGSGWYDDEMLDLLEEHGYHCALGSIYPLDAHIPSSWFASSVIRWRLEPGAIVILHDRGGRGTRAARTLAEILPELRKRGYRVVSLSELVALADARAAGDRAGGGGE